MKYGVSVVIVYACIIIWVFYRVRRSVKQNGKKGFLSDPNYRSPAQRAIEEAIEKGRIQAEKTFSTVGSSNTSSTVAKPNTTPSIKSVSAMNDQRASMIKAANEPAINRLMDDRDHDWLAGQLAEERAAKRRMSAMFELKQEHAANCDSDDLKRFHEAHCDANDVVDNPGSH